MSTQALTAPTATVSRTAVLLVAAIAVAGVANTIIALTATALGSPAPYAPLTPPVYLAFTVLGVLAGYVGWRIIRRVSARPARALKVLVPVVLLLSFVPDVMLAILQFIPGTTITGAIALGLMHIVVVATAVPVYARIAPVS